MDSSQQPAEQAKDEQLAHFADQAASGAVLPEKAGDAEMAPLEETVLQISAAALAARPDATTADRIRRKVMAHWKKPAPSWQLTGWQLRCAMALAGLLLAVGAAFFFAGPGGQLSGAAAQGSWIFPAVLLVVGVAAVLYLLRNDGQ